MLCNDVEKLSNFACNLGILCKKILLMSYGNDVKMYKIMTYHHSSNNWIHVGGLAGVSHRLHVSFCCRIALNHGSKKVALNKLRDL